HAWKRLQYITPARKKRIPTRSISEDQGRGAARQSSLMLRVSEELACRSNIAALTPESKSQRLLIRFLVEPDHQGLATAKGRRPQVAGRPKQMGQQRLVVGRVLLQVEGHDLLTPGRHDLLDRPGQRQGLVLAAALPGGVGRGAHLHVVRLKVPLS